MTKARRFFLPDCEAEWDKQKRIDKGKKSQTQLGGIRYGMVRRAFLLFPTYGDLFNVF